MKNYLLLLSFFATLGTMFVIYFVPKINQYNDIDFLEASLLKVITTVPESRDVYIFSEFLPNATATKYKTMMIMAPRIVIDADFIDIPNNEFILVIQDKNGKNSTLQTLEFIKKTKTLFEEKNDFYHVTLLKKKQ